MSDRTVWLLCAAWAAATAAGVVGLWHYSAAPGPAGEAPARWPADSRLNAAEGRPTLLIFLHPRCPCSRVSAAELAELLDDPVLDGTPAPAVTALFLRPPSRPPGWERGALWDAFAAVPGVRCATDPGGAEATRFGAGSSGTALLYDSAGRLLYAGGFTAGRGHRGPSPGRSALAASLRSAATDGPVWDSNPSAICPTYGCPLCSPAPPVAALRTANAVRDDLPLPPTSL